MGCVCQPTKKYGQNDPEWNDISNDKEGNHFFPGLAKYEEELNSNFKYFDVFWYNPNKTNDFNCFKKCFENVQFHMEYTLESTLKFF
jgi:hypothetical protein